MMYKNEFLFLDTIGIFDKKNTVKYVFVVNTSRYCIMLKRLFLDRNRNCSLKLKPKYNTCTIYFNFFFIYTHIYIFIAPLKQNKKTIIIEQYFFFTNYTGFFFYPFLKCYQLTTERREHARNRADFSQEQLNV